MDCRVAFTASVPKAHRYEVKVEGFEWATVSDDCDYELNCWNIVIADLRPQPPSG